MIKVVNISETSPSEIIEHVNAHGILAIHGGRLEVRNALNQAKELANLENSNEYVFGLTFNTVRILIKGIANFSDVGLKILSSINRFSIWVAQNYSRIGINFNNRFKLWWRFMRINYNSPNWCKYIFKIK